MRLRKPRVLVAEEDGLTVETLKAAFATIPVGVRFVSDSAAALAAFEEEPPDLVLLSVSLPGLDGFSTASRMRRKREVPVIYLTRRGIPASPEEAREQGGSGYITRPVSVAELRRKVGEVLSF